LGRDPGLGEAIHKAQAQNPGFTVGQALEQGQEGKPVLDAGE
jgi:hypothetical protein